MDASFITLIGKEIYEHFMDKKVNKILTVEASGIAFAIVVAQFFNCKMVFAKKSKSANSGDNAYSAECKSFTRNMVNQIVLPKEFLDKDDNVLVVDDFLAVGNATKALREIIAQANANLVGVSCIVEKGYQGGGDEMRKEGIDLFSLAVIDKMENGKIIFR